MNKYADFVNKEAPKKWTSENSLIAYVFGVPLSLLGGWLYEPKLQPLFFLLGFFWLLGLFYLLYFRLDKVVAKLWGFFAYFERIVDVADDDAATASKQGTSSNAVSASRQQRGLVTSDGGEVRSRASASSAVQTETLRAATSPVPVHRNGGSFPCRSSLPSMCKCFVIVTFLVMILFGVVMTQRGGASNEVKPNLSSEQPLSDVQGNLDGSPQGNLDGNPQGNLDGNPKCRKLSKTDRMDVDENLLLRKIKYRADSKDSEIDLVKELAEENRWEAVADVHPKLVSNLRVKYKETEKELEEIGVRLFRKLLNEGYKGKFGWDAYLQGLKDVENPKLSSVISDLDRMLDCLELSRTSMDEVSMQRFRFMECGGHTLHLMQDVAENEWRSVARQFGIRENSIFWERDIPQECARDMLKTFYKAAFTWQQIIDALRKAQLSKVATRLETALDSYCAYKG